MFKNE
jgi:Ran-binding protein 1